MKQQKIVSWKVLLKNRPGFNVLGRTMTEAKQHAMCCIKLMNSINDKKVTYHGIMKQ